MNMIISIRCMAGLWRGQQWSQHWREMGSTQLDNKKRTYVTIKSCLQSATNATDTMQTISCHKHSQPCLCCAEHNACGQDGSHGLMPAALGAARPIQHTSKPSAKWSCSAHCIGQVPMDQALMWRGTTLYRVTKATFLERKGGLKSLERDFSKMIWWDCRHVRKRCCRNTL